MKLAFCLFKYFPYGGLQRKMVQIAAICRKRGHRVKIFTRSWEGDRPAGLKVTLVPVRHWSNHGKNAAYVHKLLPLLKKGQYDAVVGFNKMPGLDLYYGADSCYLARGHELKPWYYRLTPRYQQFVRFERAVFDPTAAVELMMISATEQANFIRYYHTPEKRFHLLPPGIARDRMAPDNRAEIRAAWRAEFGVGDDEKVILMVGSNFKGKGLGRALKGMAALPEPLKKVARLIMIGRDKPEPFYRLADKLGLANQLQIFLGRSDVPRFYLGADLFVHPAFQGEVAGNVILEAAIVGLPVLVTESCGYAHHIARAQAGLLIPLPYRQADFNDKLALMLTSPQRESWSRNGIAYGRGEDLYGLADVAADLIERTAARKQESGIGHQKRDSSIPVPGP